MPRPLVYLLLALAVLAGVAPTAAHADTSPAPVVLIGLGGVRWSDVDAARTPALAALAREGAIGALAVRSVRTSTCPLDGWLTISAGRRAAGARTPGATEPGNPPCLPLPEQPLPTPQSGGQVAGWAQYRAAAEAERYDATVGLLGDTLAAAGVCAIAQGPGAAIAIARSDGTLPRAGPNCLLTVVDAGSVRDPADRPRGTAPATTPSTAPATNPSIAPDRRSQVAAIDANVAAALAAAPASARVVVASIADSGRTPNLQLVAVRGFGPGWLRSSSTRQVALVQLTDLTPTVLGLLGVPAPDALVGSPIRPLPAPTSAAERLEKVLDLGLASRAVAALVPTFFTGLVLAQLLLYGAAAVALRRRWASGPARDRVLAGVRRVALVFAAVPVSTYLANTVPWWRAEHPLLAIVAVVVAYVAAISLVAQVGPWRRHPLGPFGAVAGLTAAILAVDIVTGSRLQISSLMGLQPVVAGRFYGFSNVTYALFATGALLFTTAVADHLVAAGRRRLAAACVAALGVVATALDVAPRWGSDFGGPIAMVPAFAVLTLLVLGSRLSLAKALAIGATTAVLLSAVSVADWLRPADERTHLGRFVQTVIDGGALQVIVRKADQNVTILFSSVLSVLVPVGALFVAMVLMRPSSWGARALALAYVRSPTLRQGLACLLVLLGIGFAVNDSGTAIPAIGAMLAIPLVIAVSMRALADDARSEPSPQPQSSP